MKPSYKYKLNIVIGALAALLYLVIPTDLSPDVVPVVGWIDDLIAVLLAIANGLLWARKIKGTKK